MTNRSDIERDLLKLLNLDGASPRGEPIGKVQSPEEALFGQRVNYAMDKSNEYREGMREFILRLAMWRNPVLDDLVQFDRLWKEGTRMVRDLFISEMTNPTKSLENTLKEYGIDAKSFAKKLLDNG